MASLPFIEQLPPEILSEVFDYLSHPSPSEILLHEQPRQDMLHRAACDTKLSTDDKPHDFRTANLKSVSLVNQRWRMLVLPSLFKNLLWEPPLKTLKVSRFEPESMLSFLVHNNLARLVTTFTLVVDVSAEDEVEERQLHQLVWPWALESLWHQIFTTIDPLRFTIIAPPSTLAGLMNRMLFLTDAWSFDTPYHILSLARPNRDDWNDPPAPVESSVAASSSELATSKQPDSSELGVGKNENTTSPRRSAGRQCQPKSAPTSPLFTIRPWTSVLLNEGSSIRAYQTYEYFLRQAPSMLSALLGTGEYPNNQPLLPSTVVDFNFIAVFPLASHVQSLLTNLPKLDRLFVQLTPRPSNQILQDQRAMKNIDMADLWMERNMAYSHLFAELTQAEPQGNWATLKSFESGDAADKESWNMAVDYLQRSNISNWTVERDGVLVKMGDGDSNHHSAGTVVHHMLGEETLNPTLLSVPPHLCLDPMLADMYYSCIRLGPDEPPILFPTLMEDLRNLQASAGGLRRSQSLYPSASHFDTPRLYRDRHGEFVSDTNEARDH